MNNEKSDAKEATAGFYIFKEQHFALAACSIHGGSTSTEIVQCLSLALQITNRAQDCLVTQSPSLFFPLSGESFKPAVLTTRVLAC